MNYSDYIKFENVYFDRLYNAGEWNEYISLRERYVKFVKAYCRWDKVREISRKRYVRLNNARCKHFAYEAKYMPFERNKVELYEKFQLGCCHKKRQNKNKGIFRRSDAFSPTKGITYPPKQK